MSAEKHMEALRKYREIYINKIITDYFSGLDEIDPYKLGRILASEKLIEADITLEEILKRLKAREDIK